MRQSKWNLKEPWRGGHILVREGWRPARENPRYSVTLRLFICSEDKDRPSADKMTHSCFVDIDILLNLSLTFPTKQCDKWVWIDDFFSRNFDLFCLLYLPHSDPFLQLRGLSPSGASNEASSCRFFCRQITSCDVVFVTVHCFPQHYCFLMWTDSGKTNEYFMMALGRLRSCKTGYRLALRHGCVLHARHMLMNQTALIVLM